MGVGRMPKTNYLYGMGKTITLTDDQIPFWDEFIESREMALEKQLAAIRRLKKGDSGSNKTIQGWKGVPIDMGKYDILWPMIKKIEFVLNSKMKALTSTAIVNILISEFEKEKADSRRQVMSGVSSILTLNNGDEKPFYKITDEISSENLYGLNRWK